MTHPEYEHLVTLDTRYPLWDRFFCVAPLVLVGTREPDGSHDLAPKHMVTPMSWENHFGFACTPRHGTYINIEQERAFTVSYPRPSQLLETSLAAAPRVGEEKPSLQALPTFPAKVIDGVLVKDSYLHFECELARIIDGFGDNSLIIGKVVAAHVHRDALRDADRDDQDLIHAAPLLAYLHPGRIATIDQSRSFPFPPDMKK